MNITKGRANATHYVHYMRLRVRSELHEVSCSLADALARPGTCSRHFARLSAARSHSGIVSPYD